MITNSQIETALDYVVKLAMGINPLNGEDAKEDSVLNSPEIIRTMFTVKAVLEEKLFAPAQTETKAELLRLKKKKDTRKEGFPPEISECLNSKETPRSHTLSETCMPARTATTTSP